jgi:hypothetical protein|tara:strand:+ start:48 stop:236 length:189 start_codon:yes stop_codon:yes gene_type:complete
MKDKIYSFKFKRLKSIENRFIYVHAKNKKEAKQLILQKLYEINDRFTVPYIVTPEEWNRRMS